MTTAEDYSRIADYAYRADPLWYEPPYVRGTRFVGPAGKQEFEVVAPPPVSDPVTGFQAMTVAPVVNGKPDYSHVTISYAGTNPAHHADISADGQVVVGGHTAAGTQAAQALEYAREAMAKVRAEHPGASFDTVGHSLGGYLAAYVGGELHLRATTFNGPDPWDALSEQAKKWYLGEVAAGRRPWDRYLNEWDLIGNFLGDGSGSAVYVKGKPGQSLLDNHNISTAFDFNTDGSVEGAGASGRSLQEISDNLLTLVPDDMRPGMAVAMAGMVEVLRNPAVGGVVGGAVSGLMVAMDTMAASSMAANFLQMEPALQSIKAVNSSLIPQMEESLRGAKSAAAMIPFITEADIENCVAMHRLQVHNNIDLEAVAAMNRRVDAHIALANQLATSIASAAQSALAQDEQWAATYTGL